MKSNNNNRNPMTNAEIIAQIRAEIERLQPDAPKPGNMKSVDAKVAMQVHARLNKLLSFISYLERSLPAKVADDDDKVLEVDTVLFNKGVEEGKRLMMEEAYDGEFFYNPYPGIALDDCKDYDFKQREDVRVIVLPKED